MFENSDDYDFIPSGSSKLASLFDGSVVSNDLSSDLKYRAPKPPGSKKNTELNETAKSKSQSSVFLAKVISLWKLENTDYKSLGKHGLAVIGSSELNVFEVIGYKEKNNVLLRRKVNNGFKFYNQKDCFSSFYDNDNQNWLVKFDNIDDQTEFSKDIKGRGADIIVNTDPSSSVDKNSTLDNVSKPDIFPRSTALPSKPEVLPRLSQAGDKDVEDANSDSSSSQKKANILCRMAKMGQQILPNDILKNTSTDVSDSELDDSKNDHRVPPRKIKRAVPLEKHIPKEAVPPQQNYMENQVMPVPNNFNHPVQFPQQNMIGLYPQNMVGAFPQHMLSPVLSQVAPYDGFQQYIVSQNTELKMNLAQISAKLDTVLSVGNKSDIKSDDGNLKSKIKTLELRSENLLTELERYEKMYRDLQKKYKKLEEKSTESESNRSVIDNLNHQIDDLKHALKCAEEKNSSYEKLEADIEEYKSDIRQHEKTIEKQNLKLKDLEEFYEENKDNGNLKQTVDTLNDTVTNLKLKLKDFEEHFLKTEAEKQKRVEEREQVINAFSDKIKNQMNSMYQSVLGNFDENSSYTASQIKSHLAQNLKGTTFALIKEFTDIYKTENANTPNP